jgi:hypothetical protein
MRTLPYVEGEPEPNPDVAAAGFEVEARTALGQVRRAFGRLVESLPAPIRRAADLQRSLGVGKVLGWQVFRVWSAPDPLLVAPYIPSPAVLRRVLKAGAARGVPHAVIEDVAAACEAFESLIQHHAGDRGAFESMVAGLTQAPAQTTIRDRRAAFRASSRLWGVFAQAQIGCAIYNPGKDRTQSAMVMGFVGVQQLRPGVRLKVSTRSCARDDPEDEAAHGGVPVEPPIADEGPVADEGGMDLLGEFCTRPAPSFVTSELAPGVLETNLEFSGVGRSSAVTYFLRRLVPQWSSPGEGRYGISAVSRVPSEVLCLDMLVPVGWTDPATAEAGVYGNLYDVERGARRERSDRLPISETTEYLGGSIESLHTPEFGRYREMIESVLRDLGWSDLRFDVYRCRVHYPILHACVAAGASAARRVQV